jgi:dolichyl-phosphate-mannose--protein O-mannosyl transferase
VRAWLIVGFAFLLAALMLWAGITAGDAAQGVRFMFFGLTFWCATGLPFLVFQLVSEMQARLRTDVLRLELTFAERAAARGERS